MIEGPSLLEKGVEILKGVYSTMFRVRKSLEWYGYSLRLLYYS